MIVISLSSFSNVVTLRKKQKKTLSWAPYSDELKTSILVTWMNEWMNEWGIYIALYCVLLYTQSALQSYEGVSLQPPPVCSIHLDDATAATGQRRQCAHHTPATGGEEREIEPIKWMGITRRPWLIRASGGNLAKTPGLHPYSFTMSVMGFLMTTESQDLGLTSHPKDGALLTV